MTLAPATNPNHAVLDAAGREAFCLRGHMRSGTNWIGALLNLHPRVVCEGEFHFQKFFEVMTRRVAGWPPGGDEAFTRIAEGGIHGIVRACMQRIAERHPEAMRIGDRSPARLGTDLPGAKVIHITRDGRDVLVSWVFHCLSRGLLMAGPEFEASAKAWRAKFEADPESFTGHSRDLLAHEDVVRRGAREWASFVLNDQNVIEVGEIDVLPLRYEAVHADVESERARMYEFLGLDPSEAEPLGTEANTAAGFTHRGEQPQNFYRAGRVGDWRMYFTPKAAEWFNDEAGDALARLGYAESDWYKDVG